MGYVDWAMVRDYGMTLLIIASFLFYIARLDARRPN